MILAILVACVSGWLTILCLSIYAHRAMSHRSVVLHPAVANFMRFWLWFTTGAGTRAWVAVHRKHHAFVDREGDPHSPVIHGIARIFFFGYFYYRRETLDPETLEKYGRDCPDDWLERHVYVPLHLLGLALLLAIDIAAFGLLPGLIAYGVQIVWEALWAAGVINGIGHFAGYRNFDSRDSSRNIVPVGLLVSGEELHNNHHRWPRSAKFSARWWEIDIGWIVIRALAAVGLAGDIYVLDRRLDQHRVERAVDRMHELFARWREKVAHLERNRRASLTEKRQQLERMWFRLSRRLERQIIRFDQDARDRLLAVRDEILEQVRASLPYGLEIEVAPPT